jgi:HSP20 family molecular chaperone IbpA
MSNDDDDDTFEGFGGLFGNLEELLRRLGELDDEELERLRDSGTLEGDNVRVDFDYDVRTGMGPASPSRGGHPMFDGAEGTGDGLDVGAGEGATEEVAVTVFETDGGCRVTADLAGSGVESLDELELSVLDGTLVVATDERTLAEAELPTGRRVVDAQLRNGVLEATVGE